MIKLKGEVQGREILFDFSPPNKYRAVIPKELDSIYTVTLKAYDEAGNESFFGDVVVCIDFDKMDFMIIENNLSFENSSSEYEHVKIEDKYTFEVFENEVI